MHCDQFQSANGIDHFRANSVLNSAGAVRTISGQIATICNNDVVVVGAFSSTAGLACQSVGITGGITSTQRTSGFSDGGTTAYTTLTPVDGPFSNSATCNWPPLSGPQVSAIGLVAISGCSSAGTCPAGAPGCHCGGTYCVANVDSPPVPPVDPLLASAVSNHYMNIEWQQNTQTQLNVSDGVMIGAPIEGKNMSLGGDLTILASSLTPPTVDVVSGELFGTRFRSISVVSTDPCFTFSATPTYSSTGLSVTLESTSVSTCGTSGGTTCATVTPTCQHGTCRDTAIGPTCQPCPMDASGFGFSNQFCEVLVCPADCSGSVHGTCTWDVSDTYPHCVCTSQWTGGDCSSPVCSPVCSHGTCLGTSPPVCNCDSGWQGSDCNIVWNASTCPITCNGAPCSATTNFTCSCPPGYLGSFCQIPTCPDSCSGNGLCEGSPSTGPPQCTCTSGWSGSSCNQRVCIATDCLNGGSCTIQPPNNDVQCVCTDGWTGAKCELQSSPRASPFPQSAIIGVAVGGALLVGAAIAATTAIVHKKAVRARTQEFAMDIRAREMAAMTSPYQRLA